nr:tetratricopeptide repeat protein [uncultured Brachyspira sp.]
MFVKYDSLNPNDTDNLKSLSKLYYDNEEYNNAINIFLKLTELNPDESEYWYYLGNSLKNTNQNKEAKEAYKKALKINPYNQTYKEGLKSVRPNFLKSASSLVTIFFILVLIVCGIFLFKAKANLGMALPLFTVIFVLMFKTVSLLKK